MEILVPVRLLSVVVFFDNDSGDQWSALTQVVAALNLPASPCRENFYFGTTGEVSLQWSLHTEFARFTVVTPWSGNISDYGPSPCGWLVYLQGEILVASDILILRKEDSDVEDFKCNFFDSNLLIGSVEASCGLQIFADFSIHRSDIFPFGVTRYLLLEDGLNPRQIGSLVQKIVEIEGYLCLALLSLPIAKSQMVELDELGLDLRHLTALTEEAVHRDVGLLKRLEDLAAELERHIASSQYRFSASQAYCQLVTSRIQELGERRLSDGVTIKEVVTRRLAPAMQTCETVERRQEKLALRLQRTASLLRTRVEVTHEEQNRELLAQMAQRAEIQLRLQQTVEGLSIWVLTYYALGLLSYGLKATHVLGLEIDPALISGFALPVFAVAFWFSVNAAKSKHHSVA